jgi:hypothetical protein
VKSKASSSEYSSFQNTRKCKAISAISAIVIITILHVERPLMKKNFSRLFSLLGVIALVAAAAFFVTQTRATAAPTTVEDVTPGDSDSITIPAGVSEVTFTIQAGDGDGGQGSCSGAGGIGATISGTLAVEEGDVLTYIVGADGINGGSSYGGGAGGGVGGGAGGAASYLYLNGDDNENIVAAAGAGGGGAGGETNSECNSYGGSGGNALASELDGGDGGYGGDSGIQIIPGTGGTNLAAGTGGAIGPSAIGDGGSGLTGGNGGNGTSDNFSGGGGGGAGFYGGGGGAGGFMGGSGGGAGASYYDGELVSSVNAQASESGGPHVNLSYEATEETTSSTTETTAETTTTSTTQTTLPRPNNGDGNGDEISDADQSNVHTVLTNLTPQTWVTFVHPQACDFDSGFVGAESDFDVHDSQYDYPSNFFGFEINCPQPTVTVSLYFHGLTGQAKDYIPRKYLSYNDTYITLDGASMEDVTMDGKNVIKLTYSITDGGKYDNDQAVNGVIIDPASLAYSPTAAPLPTTGTNAYRYGVTGFMLLIAGGVLFVVTRRRRHRLI